MHSFLAERQDDWLEGIDRACCHFEGLPDQILCDNASPLVHSHNPRTGEVVWHPGFAIFCKDREITPRACKPCRDRTKGKIERGIGYIKKNSLAGRTFPSFEALQQHLTRWANEVAAFVLMGLSTSVRETGSSVISERHFVHYPCTKWWSAHAGSVSVCGRLF